MHHLVVHPPSPLYNLGHLLRRDAMALKLRQLSPEEYDTIDKCAHSRTAAARLVERARILLLAHQGHRVPALAHQLPLTAITVRTWLKRCNAAGLAALPDQTALRASSDLPTATGRCSHRHRADASRAPGVAVRLVDVG